MNGTKWTFGIFGVMFIIVGVATIVWAVQAGDNPARWGVGIGIGSFVIVGIVFLGVARYTGGLDTGPVLANGIPGTAEVLGVSDTGVTIHNLNAVFKVRALVTIPTRAPYETEFRVVVGRTQLGQIVPGMVLPVKVDPENPSKVAIDSDRGPATAPSFGAALPGGTPIPGMPPGVPGQPAMQTRSAADIVARGVSTTGTIQSAAPTGMTAGQFASDLAPHEANDPLVHIAFSYLGPAGETLHTQAIIRVPDGKGVRMSPGTKLPVRYLPDEPTVATIDWEGT